MLVGGPFGIIAGLIMLALAHLGDAFEGAIKDG
jgi:hypothetical protein